MISQNIPHSLWIKERRYKNPVYAIGIQERTTFPVYGTTYTYPFWLYGARGERDAPQEFALRCEEIPRRIKELGGGEEWNAKRLLDEAGIPWAKAIPREYLYSRHLPAVNPWPAIKVGRQTGLVSSSLVCRPSSLQPCNSRRSLTLDYHCTRLRCARCVRLSPSCSSYVRTRGPTTR